jgi:hypothetical protein
MDEPIIHCRYDKLISVNDLRPYPKNRNQHTDEQIARLALLLRYQGIRSPIVVAASPYDCIAKGHGTLEAIKFNGWKNAPVVFQSFDNEEQLYAYVQSDNAIQTWAELDLSGINADIGDLGPDFNIDLLGIKDFVVDPSEKYTEPNEKADPTFKEPELKTCPNCGVLIE